MICWIKKGLLTRAQFIAKSAQGRGIKLKPFSNKRCQKQALFIMAQEQAKITQVFDEKK